MILSWELEEILMKCSGWVTIVVGLLTCAFLAHSASHEKQAASPPKWDYKILSQTELDKANGLVPLGEEGWELVAVEGERWEALRVDPKFGNVLNNRTRERMFYFKRPK